MLYYRRARALFKHPAVVHEPDLVRHPGRLKRQMADEDHREIVGAA